MTGTSLLRNSVGLRLSQSQGVRLQDVTVSNSLANGIVLHGNSTNVVLDAITLTGGRTGILAEKTTKGLHVTASTIDSAHVAGMAIGGHDTLLDGLMVKGGKTTIRVERGAGGVTATNLTLVGCDDGLVTSGGTTGVVVKDLSSDSIGNSAVRNQAPACRSPAPRSAAAPPVSTYRPQRPSPASRSA